MEQWKVAKSPNYDNNKDKLYPYSELPYFEQYKLVKIPFFIKNLIEHVDYYGVGRTERDTGSIGFPDCYNVNYEYDLVRAGPDKDRRIPNRIPITKEHRCRTRNYIKDNSVLTVTVATDWYRFSQYCAEDITRMVNSDRGKVIIYGYDVNDAIDNNLVDILSEELKKMKQLFYCPIYLLPEHLQLTHFYTSYRAYLSLYELKKELYNYITKGEYEAAIILTGCLSDLYCSNALGDVVNKLIVDNIRNVMVYAYKLWNNNAKDIVCKHFPAVFKLIFNEDCLTIINKKYNQALKLEEFKEIQACGDSHDKTSNKVSWKIVPTWDDDKIRFKLYNVGTDMYLNLNEFEDIDAVQISGSRDSKESCNMFNLEPFIVIGEVMFTIINTEYGQRLMLAAEIKASGDRALLVYEDEVIEHDEKFGWTLAAWNEGREHDQFKRSA